MNTFDEILRAAQGGDGSAFEELFARVARPLVVFAHARGAEDPEGLANEVLLRAFRGIARFSGTEAQFRAWVFAIARNALADERRRQRRRPETTATPPSEMADHAAPDDPVPLVVDERVRELLAHLSPDQRDVLLLRVVADLSVADTAAAMGRSEGAVRLLQHRALTRLRRLLARGP